MQKLSGKSSREDMCRLRSKFRQTGSRHAADSKLHHTIQFSILMVCAKYRKAGLYGSWEKCDRNFFVTTTPTPDDDDARRRKTTDSDPYMSPLLDAGRRHNYIFIKSALIRMFAGDISDFDKYFVTPLEFS